MTIEYSYTEGVHACEREPLRVRRDGKFVGEIRAVVGGFAYFPNGRTRDGGKVFEHVYQVQQSLTGERNRPARGRRPSPKEADSRDYRAASGFSGTD